MRIPFLFRRHSTPKPSFPATDIQSTTQAAAPIVHPGQATAGDEAPNGWAGPTEGVITPAGLAIPAEAADSHTVSAIPAEAPDNDTGSAAPDSDTVSAIPAETPAGEADEEAEPDVNQWLRSAHEARQAGRIAEAQTMLETAAERFPETAWVRHDLARLAEISQDWAEAERRWGEFVALSPEAPWAVVQLGRALWLQGRIADAESLLAHALERFPDDAPMFVEYARLAELRGDWPEAGARWATVTERFPDQWEGPTGQARALREQGQPDQARDVLAPVLERFAAVAGPCHEMARIAEALRDWPAAEQQWRAFIVLMPEVWWGYAGLSNALREQDRLPEAETVLSEQFERLAHEPWPFIDYAKLAERSANWPAALTRWEAVISRFPALWEGYVGRTRALREQGNLTAAKDALTDAVARFPAMAAPLHDLARLAERDRDWAAAETWWRQYVALEPGPWWGHFGLSVALREQGQLPEAEAALADQLERFSQEPAIVVEYARFADRLADWPEAAKRYQGVRLRFPDIWDGYGGQARALREQGETSAARDILTDAVTRFPTLAQPRHDLARLAEMERDWAAAEKWWRQYTALDPDAWFGHTGLAIALREQGHADLAANVLTDQFERLAHEPAVFIEYARLAELERDWPEAARRWELMTSRFPETWNGYAGQARALREQGLMDEARILLEQAVDRLPSATSLLHDLAHLAEIRRDWPTAERWWRAFLARDSSVWWAHTGLATALREQRRPDETAAVLVKTLDRFPYEVDALVQIAEQISQPGVRIPDDRLETLEQLMAEHANRPDASGSVLLASAQIARELRQWDTYRSRLESMVTRLPGDWRARILLSEANELALADEAEAARSSAAAGEPLTADTELVMSFESLGGGRVAGLSNGGDGGSEFGLFQRRMGAEPLSLLRWATIQPADLLRGLADGFSALEDGDTIELLPQGHYDWQVREHHYHMQIDHTHLDRDKVDMAEARRMVLKRFSFLRRKLIEDLSLGEKIFVYRLADTSISPEAIEELGQAVNRYGTNRLLFVMRAAEQTEKFRIERLRDGLMVVTIAPPPPGSQELINHDAWLELCRFAHTAARA